RVKFCQSRDRNSKMQETVKLAQQKVGQTDSQAERLNEINDAKQKVIADLNEKIKQETDKQENDVTEFQLKLSELTQFFRDAKRAYAKDNLTKETKEWKENMDSVMNEAETKNIELEDVTKAFENLSVDTNKIKELVGEKMGHKGLTYKELKAAIDQLTRKQEQLHKFLKWLESCESDAKAEIQAYNKRCLTAEQERGNSVVETEMADVIVRDITPAQIYQSTRAAGEGQRFPNGEQPSRNEHCNIPANYPVQQNSSQLANNVDQGLRNHHHVPIQNAAPVTLAASGHFPERVNDVVDQEARNRHTVPNQNTVPDTRAASGYFPERVNNVVDQEARNNRTVSNQNTVPDTRTAPAQIPERANVGQGSRNHHAVPNTPAASRTVPGHIAAVNSPSFFISLPFGRTR
ncbi:Hypothetical predicted protein, partial [Paramuricea clavata]